jgi:hypothetical protein
MLRCMSLFLAHRFVRCGAQIFDATGATADATAWRVRKAKRARAPLMITVGALARRVGAGRKRKKRRFMGTTAISGETPEPVGTRRGGHFL